MILFPACWLLQEFHRLHVGDVIKFGESTRLYALEGPEELRPAEYESENLVSQVKSSQAEYIERAEQLELAYFTENKKTPQIPRSGNIAGRARCFRCPVPPYGWGVLKNVGCPRLCTLALLPHGKSGFWWKERVDPSEPR